MSKVDIASPSKKGKQGKPLISAEEAGKIIEKQKQEEENEQNQIRLNMKTEQGVKDALQFQMRIFDVNYDFGKDELASGDKIYLEYPTLEEIYYYCKYVIVSGRMEKEIPILCLVYLERFFMKTGILMNFANWKRLTLISLILASKLWDDDSLENVHFP